MSTPEQVVNVMRRYSCQHHKDPDKECVACEAAADTELAAATIEKLTQENTKLTAIYHAAEDLMCPLGAKGELTLHTQMPLVEALMDSFFEFDEGRRKATISAIQQAEGEK